MSRFGVTLEIRRSAEDVYAYLTDVSKVPEWQASAQEARCCDAHLHLGSRIRERRSFLGRDVRTELEVTAFEPPRRLDLESRGGPVSYAIAHTLEPLDAATRLTVEVDVRLGTIMRLAAQGPLKIAERELHEDFERLKENLESSNA